LTIAFNPCTHFRGKPVAKCIYCGSSDLPLTDEHVVPLGLAGRAVLPNSSCKDCAAVTGGIEQKLLRGAFWPLRRKFGLVSNRRPKEQPDWFPATLIRSNGLREPIEVNASDYPEVWMQMFEPSIHQNQLDSRTPSSKSIHYRQAQPPKGYRQFGKFLPLVQPNRIEFPYKLESETFMRFLAKLALSYIWITANENTINDDSLRELILGKRTDLMTFVGGNSSSILGPTLPGYGLHRIAHYRRNQLTIVAMQFFVPLKGDATPIYEVVIK
jgi:hypothetical protein